MSIVDKKSNNFWLKLKKKRPRLPAPENAANGGQAILALAPMAGITDSAFRQMCRKYGADVVYTEMISADGLYYDSKKTLAMLKFAQSEHPIVIQLFGKDPSKFTKAAQICEQAGFDGIDINFGCPARKVVGHGGGVTLMRDLPKCREIIEATLKGTSLPVSVKLRSSINVIARERSDRGNPEAKTRDLHASLRSAQDDNAVTALDFLKFMSNLPLVAVMIHGRSYEKPFDGEIDYGMIKKCVQYCRKEMPQTIVLGNGGIKKPEDAKKMIDKTASDGVGLARGLYGRPWLFKQCKDYLKTGEYQELTVKEIKKAILLHARLAFKSKETHGLIELRKHLLWYVSGWPNAKELRSKLVRVEDISQIKEILK